jgi:hypothetical protein
MNKIRSLLIFSVLILSISACQNHTVDPLYFLTDPLCELPCWNLITPGKTTALEAEEILRTSSIVAKDSIFQQNLTGYEDPVIRWKFENNGEGLIIVQNDLVLMIELNSTSSDRIGVTLSDVVDKFGEPDVVFSAFNPEIPYWGTISFLYPENGLNIVYAAQLEKDKYRTSLRPETPMSGINIFSPNSYSELAKTYFLGNTEWSQEEVNGSIYPWKGYGSISVNYPTAFGKK